MNFIPSLGILEIVIVFLVIIAVVTFFLGGGKNRENQ